MRAGADDAAYLGIVNRVGREFPDQTPTTLDKLQFERTMPYHDPHGYFIAEIEGRAVGVGHGLMDPLDKERIGWVDVDVLPEFRRRHVGTALAEAALQGLRSRGAGKLRAGAREENVAGNALIRSLGFLHNRSASRMRRSMDTLLGVVGTNNAVSIRETTLDDDDLQLTVNLINEAFKEDWDFTPTTVEARRKRAAELARQGGVVQTWVAMLEGRAVGVVQALISPRDNETLKVQRGVLMGLGVLRPFRGQGIAKTLMIRGLDFLKTRGMTETDLFVDNSNPAQALDIYLKLGFHVVRRFLDYEMPESGPRNPENPGDAAHVS